MFTLYVYSLQVCNQWKYGRLVPPAYDLSTIRVPVALISGALFVARDCGLAPSTSALTPHACARLHTSA